MSVKNCVSRLFPILFGLFAVPCFAQSPCRVRPGDHIIPVPLQGAPDSFEPTCQPARIRVDDRKPVTLHLTGLSPLDVCLVASKPQTVTTVTPPAQSIIAAVAGLGPLSLETHNIAVTQEMVMSALAPLKSTPPPQPETPLDLFRALFNQFTDATGDVFSKQVGWQKNYQSDLDSMTQYLAKDYRANYYSQFNPDRDLASVQQDAALPSSTASTPSAKDIPTEQDYAPLQILIDEMSSLQTGLTTPCTKPPVNLDTDASTCNPDVLKETTKDLDAAKAALSVAQDNLKTLQAEQAAVATAYAAIHKAFVDYQTRLTVLKTVQIDQKLNKLVQDIKLGSDYGATDTGSVTCMSDAAPTQATTDAINFSVLYQDVPEVTVSTGVLLTFLKKTDIGTESVLNSDGTTTTNFAVTDSAPASVFPMAFFNIRTWPPVLKTWWGRPESELVITNNASFGIGVNSNTGTNQPEFFAGDAVGFSRFYIHIGAHFGRTESLGGGFQLNTPIPASGFNGTAPIDWSYHVGFSLGFSFRVAPF